MLSELASATVERFVERATRLYEHERAQSRETPLLGQYVRRWLGWAHGGLSDKPKACFEAAKDCKEGKVELLLCFPTVETKTC